MANVLITGGAGFIGANFASCWTERHPKDNLVVIDALAYAGNIHSLARLDAVLFVHDDIRNMSLVSNLLRVHDTDNIVHFAAESHVVRSIDGPDAFIDTNIIGTRSLLNVQKRHGLIGARDSAIASIIFLRTRYLAALASMTRRLRK